MRNETLIDVNATARGAQRAQERHNGHTKPLQEAEHISEHSIRATLEQFLPHGRLLRMTQEAKGVFIPYPLLGILIIIGGAMLSFVIAIEVQVSNLNTTILLREADQRAEITAIKEKTAQLEVYIHNDREKLVRIETQQDREPRRR